MTGVVVNVRPTAPRRQFDALKATLHNCVIHGPESQNRTDRQDFRAHPLGRIAWMESLYWARGLPLRRDFERISW